MNIICIDPSLTCTAVVVNDNKAVFVTNDKVFTKTGKMGKWFEITAPYCEYFYHDLDSKSLSYADTELNKVAKYDEITDHILDYITKHCDSTQPSKIFIEGYSFSSAAGPLIDLVTFGTLLRGKLFWTVSKDLNIIAPTSLKLYAAKLTYQKVIEKKKEVWRNADGISGGSFTKPDMYKALIENPTLQCDYVNFLRTYAADVLGKKEVPKPIEDMNDAKLMYEVAKANKYM